MSSNTSLNISCLSNVGCQLSCEAEGLLPKSEYALWLSATEERFQFETSFSIHMKKEGKTEAKAFLKTIHSQTDAFFLPKIPLERHGFEENIELPKSQN